MPPKPLPAATLPGRRVLTPKQEAFCQVVAYKPELSYTQAYLEAGYRATAKTARIGASRLLTLPNIEARVRELRQQRAQRLDIQTDPLVRRAHAIALTSLAQVASWGDGELTLKPSADLTEAEAAAIMEVEETSRERLDKQGRIILQRKRKIKMHPKLPAIELLLKAAGNSGP